MELRKTSPTQLVSACDQISEQNLGICALRLKKIPRLSPFQADMVGGRPAGKGFKMGPVSRQCGPAGPDIFSFLFFLQAS